LLAACGKQPAGQVPPTDNTPQPDPPEAAAQPLGERTGPVALRFGQSGIVGQARVTVPRCPPLHNGVGVWKA